MPGLKQPTSAEKLMMLQAMGQQMAASGKAPSQQVQVALRSFQTAPTPEEIQKVADDMVRGGNPAAAVEFQAYASHMAGPTNKLRQDTQARADAGVGPSPVVAQALSSFDEAPSVEQIQTIGNYLRKTQGEAAGQEFETYAATALRDKAGTPPPTAPQSPGVALTNVPNRDPNYRPGVEIGKAQIEPSPARQGVTTVEAPQAQPATEQTLVQRAKDIGQGFGHLVTLGAIPAPDSVLSGNDRLRAMVGLKPLKKGEKETKKEKQLIEEAKKTSGPRQGVTDTTPINTDELLRRKDEIYSDDNRAQFRNPPPRIVGL